MTSELKRCCAECSYWEANPQEPLPAPLEPTTRKFLWWTWLSEPDSWEEAVQDIRRASIIVHNREGVCSRFPKVATTEKSYLCGEWVWKASSHDQ